MKATIHPYKGYLNTEFQLLSQSEKEVSYFISHKDSGEAEKSGLLQPNIPQKIILSNAGKYDVVFDDGSKTEIFVEDGYKFGGGSHKAFFIFDECPWIFVVMRDRTYFHNRKTGEEYVEVISPDSIIEVSDEYVLMQNNGQDEVTLFSLIEQKPLICASNILYHNHFILVWAVNDSDNKTKELVIYSLSKKEEILREEFDYVSVEKANGLVHYAKNNLVHSIYVDSDGNHEKKSFAPKGTFGAFAQMNCAIFIENIYGKNIIIIYDLVSQAEKNRFLAKGSIARINDHDIISLSKRRQSILNFNIEDSEFPEAVISASYTEYDIYPSRTKTFYTEKINNISTESKSVRITRTLKATGSDLNDTIGVCDDVIINDNIFCIYGYREYIIIPLDDIKQKEHNHNGTIRHHGEQIILDKAGGYATLNQNGTWDDNVEGEFDFSYFKNYGIILNKKTKVVQNFSLGKFIVHYNTNDIVKTEKGRISRGGNILWINKDEYVPTHFSPKFTYGIELKDNKILLYTTQNNKLSEPQIILESLFDTSKFSNAFLSENGRQIMHRNNDVYRMIDLDTGESTEFNNLSFVEHINGLRPQFRILETSQALLINPMNGLPVKTHLLNEYQFVSPDGTLYADKALGMYIEYYDHIQQRIISHEEYLELYNKFNLLVFDEAEHIERVQNRKEFVKQNCEYFIGVLQGKGYKKRTTGEYEEFIIDEKNIYGISWFLELFIEKRGIAVICRTEDKSEVARIKLGFPLEYLNYVSFSYDNHYVAIAGKYPDRSGFAGLFLVYDLVENKKVVDSKSSYAVWVTAFTKDNVVAAYTSFPNSIICNINELPEQMHSEVLKIDNGFPVRGVNFLSFSPDGSIFACSHQGYIPYRDKDGNINKNWGHQPSSLVSIRKVDSPDDEIISYSDISDEGVERYKRSVASVSFSNDNSRLMMVGKDGVVIVRNIHLEK